mmetsp:Transcript_42452/g.120474  ORF Transcript_42452/g.120474 Transcript_42452/m.120474 type:complete len:129 (-) Transcript_42452:193-579(-)
MQSVGWREGWVSCRVVGFFLSSSVYRFVSPSLQVVFSIDWFGCHQGNSASVSVFLFALLSTACKCVGGDSGDGWRVSTDPSSFCAWDVKGSITTWDSQPIDHPIRYSVSLSVCLALTSPPTPTHSQAL